METPGRSIAPIRFAGYRVFPPDFREPIRHQLRTLCKNAREYRRLLYLTSSVMGRVPEEFRPGVARALILALEGHGSQRRLSGELYIFHPLRVMQILMDQGFLWDEALLQAALLHDVIEDTEIDLQTIEEQFGEEVARLVNGLTKIQRLVQGAFVPNSEDLRRILLHVAQDIRIIFVKLADRLDNMRSVEALPRERQIRYATETWYAYAPLAHWLGLYRMKMELDDLSFRVLYPEEYARIRQSIDQRFPRRGQALRTACSLLNQLLKPLNLHYRLETRIKTPASIYLKMQRKGVQLEEIYDILAVRVILEPPYPENDEVRACFQVLSTLYAHEHAYPYTIYAPRTRIWIGKQKKNNQYEAIHLTIFLHQEGVRGYPIEIQIRSQRMHEQAEIGIAVHYAYKEGKKQEDLERVLQQVRAILHNPDPSNLELLRQVRVQTEENTIRVYTPMGEARMLPVGATVLDFAFAIHSHLGLHCIGGRVNQKIVPLNHTLTDGDVVEVLTARSQQPQPDWLRYVRTARARRALRAYFRRRAQADIQQGREKLKQFFREHGLRFSRRNLQTLAYLYAQGDLYVFYYLLGRNELELRWKPHWKNQDGYLVIQEGHLGLEEVISQVQARLLYQHDLLPIPLWERTTQRRQTCCQPVPGDMVVVLRPGNHNQHNRLGFPFVEVHTLQCERGKALLSEYGARVLKTAWTPDQKIAFLIQFRLKGEDRPGVIYELSRIFFRELGLNLSAIHLESLPNGTFQGSMSVYIAHRNQMDRLLTRIRQLPFIHEIQPEASIFAVEPPGTQPTPQASSPSPIMTTTTTTTTATTTSRPDNRSRTVNP